MRLKIIGSKEVILFDPGGNIEEPATFTKQTFIIETDDISFGIFRTDRSVSILLKNGYLVVVEFESEEEMDYVYDQLFPEYEPCFCEDNK